MQEGKRRPFPEREKPWISASILSADSGKIPELLPILQKSGVDFLHLDVMDGIFVPNITFGPWFISGIRKLTDLPFDVHLMIEEPSRYLSQFVSAGAEIISVHAEATRHLHRTVMEIREKGVLAGVAINPATPVEAIEPVLGEIDLVLVMGVNPGFSGQKFLSFVLKKVEKLSSLREKEGFSFLIEVDGGVGVEEASFLIPRGVDLLVSAKTLFSSENFSRTVELLRRGK